VTYGELNTALPAGQVSSEQIEDTMTMLSELGIDVIEGEERNGATEADEGSGNSRVYMSNDHAAHRPVGLPKPKIVTSEEVVLAREDWDRLIADFGADVRYAVDEDEDDIAAVRAARADDRQYAAHLEAERGFPIETTVPLEVVKAKLDGVHPIKAWRDHRGWTQVHLSFKSGVGRDLIAQIETRRKNGSVETLSRLARALSVPIEALTEE